MEGNVDILDTWKLRNELLESIKDLSDEDALAKIQGIPEKLIHFTLEGSTSKGLYNKFTERIRAGSKMFGFVFLGKMFQRSGEFLRAISLYEKAISLGWPNRVEIGSCFERLEDYENAVRVYSEKVPGEFYSDSLLRLVQIKLGVIGNIKPDPDSSVIILRELADYIEGLQKIPPEEGWWRSAISSLE